VKLAVTGSSSVGRLGIYQVIEDYKKLAGREVTVSCKLKATAPNCYLWVYDGSSYIKIAEHSGNSSWESLSGTINVSSSASQFRVYVKYSSSAGNSDTPNALTSSDYFEVAEVQLELGKVATPFEHRSYGEELALCQRYYEEVPLGRITGYHIAAVRAGFQWKVNKRAAPTVTFSSSVLSTGASVTLSPSGPTTYGMSINATASVASSGIQSQISIDAEL